MTHIPLCNRLEYCLIVSLTYFIISLLLWCTDDLRTYTFIQAESETNVPWSRSNFCKAWHSDWHLIHLHLSFVIVNIKVDRHMSHTSQRCFHTTKHTLWSKYDASDEIHRQAALPVGSGNGVNRRFLLGWSMFKKTCVDSLNLMEKLQSIAYKGF